MSKIKPLFVTGIGTDVGKTVIAAVLVEKLKADYWKPIQSGDLDNSDTMKVQRLISNSAAIFHPEAYRLTQPYSPHKSAALDGVQIDPARIVIPATPNALVIEGAGGLMVPLNDNYLMIDLIKQLDADVVLVSRNYLGSINHTLLSLALLKQENVKVRTLIFNGETDAASEDLIIKHAAGIIINRVPLAEKLDKDYVRKQAGYLEL